MMRGWKQRPTAVQRDGGKKPLAAALLALVIAPLGCQDLHSVLDARDPAASGKPEAVAGTSAASTAAAQANGLPEDPSGPIAQMVSEMVQHLAGVSSSSPEDLEAHPIASNVTRLMCRLSGAEPPEEGRIAGDQEAVRMLAGASPQSGPELPRASGTMNTSALQSNERPRLASRPGKEIVPVAYAISTDTGGVVVAQEPASGPRGGKPDSRPTEPQRGPGGAEQLPTPLAEEEKPADKKEEEGFRLPPSSAVIPKPCETQLIDLSDAFGVAANQNPTIGLAQAEIGESVALLRQAQFLALPTLRGGTNYHYHTGFFQASTGEIKDRTLQAFYIGGGARTLAAESMLYPMIQIVAPLTDAIFEPQVAHARVDRSRFNLAATNNRILMEVGDQYLRLVGAEARLLAVLQTEDELDEVARRTRDYRRTGAGSVSDERRAQAEAALMRVNEQRLQEEVAVEAAQLSRLLHLDPSVRLTTGSGPLKLFHLPPPCADLESLIEIALNTRPEVKEGAANIAMNQARYRRERARPLLPLLIFGYSAGSFGGGGNFYSVNKIAGNMGPRTDLDAMAVWNVQNLGLGNLALQKGQRAAVWTAQADLGLVVNDVRREVTDSYATLQARQRELEVARLRLRTAHQGFDHDMNLIRNQLNIRPIELLNSVTLLYRARQSFIIALVTYNQAQLDLFVRLGRPPTMAAPEVQTVLMPDSDAVNEHKKQLRAEQARAEQAQAGKP